MTSNVATREMLDLSSPADQPLVSRPATSSEIENLAAARVGTVLKGKWQLDAVLGSGGTATVYAATHRNGNRVAVKILHPCYSNMPAERERFAREGYLANKVEHPGVVRVLDEDVDDDGSPFLVMELLEGEPLVARWKTAGYRLPVPEVLWMADRLLAVLEAAHAQGIIHRDVKPENLFLTAAGELKVLDFGIARMRGVGSGTMRGIVLGTPGFTAPEQARGEWDVVGARTDIWAVGATLFALLTGRLVHEEERTAAHLLRVSMEPVPPVRNLEPNLPECVARVIDRALAFSPQNRFQTAMEMRQGVATAYRLTTGQRLGDRPAETVTNAGYNPTLRVTTGTTVVTPSSHSPKVRVRTPFERWDAAAMATAFFALGGIFVGYFASHQATASASVAETALVAPLPPPSAAESSAKVAEAKGAESAQGSTELGRAAEAPRAVATGTERPNFGGSASDILSAARAELAAPAAGRGGGEPPRATAPASASVVLAAPPRANEAKSPLPAARKGPAENAGLPGPAVVRFSAPSSPRLPSAALPGTAPRQPPPRPATTETFDFVESRR
jgi:serine/threonine-protein kinase